MECNRQENLNNCPCSYPNCPRKGICCQCIIHHRQKQELPGCYFSKEVEREYDRSIANFIEKHSNN